MFSTCVRRLRGVSAHLAAAVAAVGTGRRAVAAGIGRGGVRSVAVVVVGARLRAPARRGHVRRRTGGGRATRTRLTARIHIPCNVTCQQKKNRTVLVGSLGNFMAWRFRLGGGYSQTTYRRRWIELDDWSRFFASRKNTKQTSTREYAHTIKIIRDSSGHEKFLKNLIRLADEVYLRHICQQ